MDKLRITYQDTIVSLGSCFADNIGKLLSEQGYNILCNPFGVLYNPASIAGAFSRLESGENFTERDIVLRDPNYGSRKGISLPTATPSGHRPIAPCVGGYVSFFHHGSFARSTPEEFLSNANDALKMARKQLIKSNIILITLGTSWVYRHIEKGIIVANCHKHLASEFQRERMGVDEIEALFAPLLQEKTRKWVFTVSPIPHLKDGFEENRLSKETLLEAEKRLCNSHSNAIYFPAYEFVTEQLGGYSKEVIPAVWELFKSYIDL